MKINFKLVLINILVLVLLVGLLEIISYTLLTNKYKSLLDEVSQIRSERLSQDIKVKIEYKKPIKFSYDFMKSRMREPNIKHSNKGSIVLFGCSFTYGDCLDKNQTLSAKLADISNRTVYNRGVAGSGLSLIYKQLSDKNLKKEIPHAEYVIYTFIPDHFGRLFYNRMSVLDQLLNLRYEIKDDKLVEIKQNTSILQSLFTTILIQDYLEEKQNNNIKLQTKMFEKMMMESYKLAQEKYPGSKFVILIYPDKSSFPMTEYTKQQIAFVKSLKDKGVIVVDVTELVGHDLLDEKYYAYDKMHPSEEAWNEIVPKLANRLKL